jgi:hypothetical protein
MNPEGLSSEINLEYARRAILTGLKQRLRQETDGSRPGEKVLSFVFHDSWLR